MFNTQRFYHTNVPTAPAGNVGETSCPLNRILKVALVDAVFNTIKTLCPAGVKNATLVKLLTAEEAMRTEPGRTNLAAWAIM